ncbi:NADAR family protein [Campylobacter hyointestinalis]|uniref:NADAR family protein n=1 Tax=Campylobacter hyointestinalis TaxID=198 RepID=UPI000CE52284|nr:NADAR family protein [Campylobacter hyointestinalis]PPB52932.1 hypothetical protein CDQ67_09345 [Campylobacter hyointestinalis subsp. hyointestinalis]
MQADKKFNNLLQTALNKHINVNGHPRDIANNITNEVYADSEIILNAKQNVLNHTTNVINSTYTPLNSSAKDIYKTISSGNMFSNKTNDLLSLQDKITKERMDRNKYEASQGLRWSQLGLQQELLNQDRAELNSQKDLFKTKLEENITYAKINDAIDRFNAEFNPNSGKYGETGAWSGFKSGVYTVGGSLAGLIDGIVRNTVASPLAATMAAFKSADNPYTDFGEAYSNAQDTLKKYSPIAHLAKSAYSASEDINYSPMNDFNTIKGRFKEGSGYSTYEALKAGLSDVGETIAVSTPEMVADGVSIATGPVGWGAMVGRHTNRLEVERVQNELKKMYGRDVSVAEAYDKMGYKDAINTLPYAVGYSALNAVELALLRTGLTRPLANSLLSTPLKSVNTLGSKAIEATTKNFNPVKKAVANTLGKGFIKGHTFGAEAAARGLTGAAFEYPQEYAQTYLELSATNPNMSEREKLAHSEEAAKMAMLAGGVMGAGSKVSSSTIGGVYNLGKNYKENEQKSRVQTAYDDTNFNSSVDNLYKDMPKEYTDKIHNLFNDEKLSSDTAKVFTASLNNEELLNSSDPASRSKHIQLITGALHSLNSGTLNSNVAAPLTSLIKQTIDNINSPENTSTLAHKVIRSLYVSNPKNIGELMKDLTKVRNSVEGSTTNTQRASKAVATLKGIVQDIRNDEDLKLGANIDNNRLNKVDEIIDIFGDYYTKGNQASKIFIDGIKTVYGDTGREFKGKSLYSYATEIIGGNYSSETKENLARFKTSQENALDEFTSVLDDSSNGNKTVFHYIPNNATEHTVKLYSLEDSKTFESKNPNWKDEYKKRYLFRGKTNGINDTINTIKATLEAINKLENLISDIPTNDNTKETTNAKEETNENTQTSEVKDTKPSTKSSVKEETKFSEVKDNNHSSKITNTRKQLAKETNKHTDTTKAPRSLDEFMAQMNEFKQDLKEELKQEIKQELKQELNQGIKSEVKSKIKPEVTQEVKDTKQSIKEDTKVEYNDTLDKENTKETTTNNVEEETKEEPTKDTDSILNKYGYEVKDSTIHFGGRTGKNDPLSNMYESPFVANLDELGEYSDKEFKSVEHAYQLAKALYSPTAINNKALLDRIYNANTPVEAKRLTKFIKDIDTNKWREDNIDILKNLQSQRIQNDINTNEELKSLYKYIVDNNIYLVEDSSDTFFGVNNKGVGSNINGRVLRYAINNQAEFNDGTVNENEEDITEEGTTEASVVNRSTKDSIFERTIVENEKYYDEIYSKSKNNKGNDIRLPLIAKDNNKGIFRLSNFFKNSILNMSTDEIDKALNPLDKVLRKDIRSKFINNFNTLFNVGKLNILPESAVDVKGKNGTTYKIKRRNSLIPIVRNNPQLQNLAFIRLVEELQNDRFKGFINDYDSFLNELEVSGLSLRGIMSEVYINQFTRSQTRTQLATRLGEVIFKDLPLTFDLDSNSKEDVSRLKVELGQYAIEAAIKTGLLTEHKFKKSDIYTSEEEMKDPNTEYSLISISYEDYSIKNSGMFDDFRKVFGNLQVINEEEQALLNLQKELQGNTNFRPYMFLAKEQVFRRLMRTLSFNLDENTKLKLLDENVKEEYDRVSKAMIERAKTKIQNSSIKFDEEAFRSNLLDNIINTPTGLENLQGYTSLFDILESLKEVSSNLGMDITRDNSIRLQPTKVTKDKNGLAIIKLDNGSYYRANKELTKALDIYNNTKYIAYDPNGVFNKFMSEVDTKAIKSILGASDLTTATNIHQLASLEGKELNASRTLEGYQSLYKTSEDQDGKLVTPAIDGFYVQAEASAIGRQFFSGFVNPQSNKFFRFFTISDTLIGNYNITNDNRIIATYNKNGKEITVDRTDVIDTHIAQAFGYKTDKKDGAILFGRKIRELDIDKLEESMFKAFNKGELEFSLDGLELNMEHPSHALQTLSDLKSYRAALDGDTKSFKALFLAEYDGVNNGPAILMSSMPLHSTTLKNLSLTAIGNNAGKYHIEQDKKQDDLYTRNAEVVKDRFEKIINDEITLDDKIDASIDNFITSNKLNRDKVNINTLKGLLKTLLQTVQEISSSKSSRNFMKLPTQTISYAAGNPEVMKNTVDTLIEFGSENIDNLYKFINEHIKSKNVKVEYTKDFPLRDIPFNLGGKKLNMNKVLGGLLEQLLATTLRESTDNVTPGSKLLNSVIMQSAKLQVTAYNTIRDHIVNEFKKSKPELFIEDGNSKKLSLRGEEEVDKVTRFLLPMSNSPKMNANEFGFDTKNSSIYIPSQKISESISSTSVAQMSLPDNNNGSKSVTIHPKIQTIEAPGGKQAVGTAQIQDAMSMAYNIVASKSTLDKIPLNVFDAQVVGADVAIDVVNNYNNIADSLANTNMVLENALNNIIKSYTMLRELGLSEYTLEKDLEVTYGTLNILYHLSNYNRNVFSMYNYERNNMQNGVDGTAYKHKGTADLNWNDIPIEDLTFDLSLDLHKILKATDNGTNSDKVLNLFARFGDNYITKWMEYSNNICEAINKKSEETIQKVKDKGKDTSKVKLVDNLNIQDFHINTNLMKDLGVLDINKSILDTKEYLDTLYKSEPINKSTTYQSLVKDNVSIHQVPFNSDEKASPFTNRTFINAAMGGTTVAVGFDFNTSGEVLTQKLVNLNSNRYERLDLKKAKNTKNGEEYIKQIAKNIADYMLTSSDFTLNIAGNTLSNSKSYLSELNAKEIQNEYNTYIKSLVENINKELESSSKKITKIYSGVQSGADLGGLISALELGIKFEGYMPKGFLMSGIDGSVHNAKDHLKKEIGLRTSKINEDTKVDNTIVNDSKEKPLSKELDELSQKSDGSLTIGNILNVVENSLKDKEIQDNGAIKTSILKDVLQVLVENGSKSKAVRDGLDTLNRYNFNDKKSVNTFMKEEKDLINNLSKITLGKNQKQNVENHLREKSYYSQEQEDSINILKTQVDTKLDSTNVIEYFDMAMNADKTKGLSLDTEFASELREQLTKLSKNITNLFKDVNLTINDVKGEINSGYFEVNGSRVVINNSSSNLSGHASVTETYFHEINHAINDAILDHKEYGKLYQRDIGTLINHVLENGLSIEAIADNIHSGNRQTDLDLATRIWEHMFNQSNHVDGLKEFVSIGLSNPAVAKVLKSIDIKDIKTNTSKNVFEILFHKVFSFFKKILDSKLDKSTNAYESLVKLQYKMAKANANVKHNSKNILKKYNFLEDKIELGDRLVSTVLGKIGDTLIKALPKDDSVLDTVRVFTDKNTSFPTRFINGLRLVRDLVDKPSDRDIVLRALEELKIAYWSPFKYDSLIRSVINDFIKPSEFKRKIQEIALASNRKDSLREKTKHMNEYIYKELFKETKPTDQEARELGSVILSTNLARISEEHTIDEVINLYKTDGLDNKIKSQMDIIRNGIKDSKYKAFSVDEYIRYIEYQTNNLANYMKYEEALYSGIRLNASNIANVTGVYNLQVSNDVIKAVELITALKALKLSDESEINTLDKFNKSESKAIDSLIKAIKAHKERSRKELFKDNEYNMIDSFMNYDTDTSIDFRVADLSMKDNLEAEGYKLVKVVGKGDEAKGWFIDNSGLRSDNWNRTALNYTSMKGKGFSVQDNMNELLANGADPKTVLDAGKKEFLKLRKEEEKAIREMFKNPNLKASDKRGDILIPLLGKGRKGYMTTIDFRFAMSRANKIEYLGLDMDIFKAIANSNAILIDKIESEKINKDIAEAIFEEYETHHKELKSGKGLDKTEALKEQLFVELSYDSKDPYIREVYKLLPNHFKFELEEKFKKINKPVMVKRDTLLDIFGYKSWDVRNSSIFKYLNDRVANKTGFKVALYSFGLLRKISKLAKKEMVMKMPSTIIGNQTSNTLSLMDYGMSIKESISSQYDMWLATKDYYKTYYKYKELELSKSNGNKVNETLFNSLAKHLINSPVYDLIAAGYFNTIANDKVTKIEDKIDIIDKHMEKYKTITTSLLGKKLGGVVNDSIEQLFITDNTALGQFLEDFVNHSDFISRAALYRHLTLKKGWSKKEALEEVLDVFINYDIATGKFRKAIEDHGFMQFSKYFTRVQRVIFSKLLFKRPISSLMILMPQAFIGDISDIFDGNVFSKNYDTLFTNPYELAKEAVSPALFNFIPKV